MINIHKNKKEVAIFLSFFFFEEKDMTQRDMKKTCLLNPCTIYVYIMEFMQIKLKEL